MEEQSNKPTEGTWDRLGSSEGTNRLVFELNKEEAVTFLTDAPEERPSHDEGVYYVFDVMHNEEEKTISTSAWTLLNALKALGPLKGKSVTITKKLESGKQKFVVTDVTV